MNCEICSKKFTRLKDLARHGTSEKHRHFFCIPCAMSLCNLTEVAEHAASLEHSITVLATGVGFDIGDECPDVFSPSFPAHNLCLLCGNRDGTPDNAHLKTDAHRYAAWLLRAIIKTKKMYCNDTQATFQTQVFISKMINAKQNRCHAVRKFRGSSPFACELCNLHFNKQECYKQHLEDQSHERMEQFLIKMSLILEGIDIIGTGYHTTVSKTFCNSVRPLFHCEVCCMWIDTIFNYIQHRKSNKHKNAELNWKRSIKRKIDDVKLHDVASSEMTHYYTKLKTEKYRQQLKSECYSRKASKMLKTSQPSLNYSVGGKHQINNLISSEMVMKKEENLCCRTRETLENSVAGQATGRSSSRPGLEAGETSRNSPPRRGFEDVINSDSPQRKFEDKEADANTDQEHYCELCDFLTYNSLHYGKHLMCEQHKRMRKLINKKRKEVCDCEQGCESSGRAHPLQYNCELCDVLNRDFQEYDHHLNSVVHRRKQWLLYVLKQRPLS